MRDSTFDLRQSNGALKRFGRRCLLALLAAVVSAPAAWPQSTVDGDWSGWKPLGAGFAGRKRVPPERDRSQEQGRESATAEARDNLLQKSQNGTLWLRTTEEGLYRVSVAELAEQIGHPERSLRAWLKQGTKLALTNAGTTKPWYFDEAADAFYFVGEVYETFFTDTNAYRLREGSPLVMTKRAGVAPPSGRPGSPFRDTLRFEEEPEGMALQWAVTDDPDGDFWFWGYLYVPYVPQLEVPLEIPGAAAAGDGVLRIRLRGGSDLETGNDHRVRARLNGVAVGNAIEWDGLAEARLVVSFPQTLLAPSGSNTLTLVSERIGSSVALQFLDDIEVDYWRAPYARDGELWLHKVPRGVHTVGGFEASDIKVIESPNTSKARWRTDVTVARGGGGTWQVTFAAAATADYFVAEGAAVRSPVVEADASSSLRTRRDIGDYLIIAPRELEQTAEALKEHRSGRFSGVQIVWLDDIYGEYGAGRVDPYAIRVFLADLNRGRSLPRFVTLLGKGTIDHKDRLGRGDSLLPVIMAMTPWGVAASDNRLMDVNGDDLIDVAYGRIPVADETEGLAYLTKLAAHEGAIGPIRRAVVVADDPDDGGEFHANADATTAQLVGLGYTDTVGLYHCVTSEQRAAHPEECADVRAALVSSATWEAAYLSYDGHGGARQIGGGGERFLTVGDVASLANSATPVFVALTCAAGDDTQPGWNGLAASLVRQDGGGVIASLAPTGLSYDADAQQLGTEFINGLLGSGLSMGEAARRAQEWGAGRVAGFVLRIYQVIGEPAVAAR